MSLRRIANRLSDEDIDALFELARTDGIMPLVRNTAHSTGIAISSCRC